MGLIKNNKNIIVKRLQNSDGSYSYTCDKSFDYIRNVALNENINVLLITSNNTTKILMFSRVEVSEVQATGQYAYVENGKTYLRVEDVRFKSDGTISRELLEVQLT